MTLADPRALADFYDLLPVATVQLMPQTYQTVDGLGSGDILVEDQASPLWTASIAIDWVRFAAARELDAVLNSLRPPRQFYLRDTARRCPAADPDGGATLATRTIKVHAIGDDNVSLAFEGFEAGYPLTRGDFFHIGFGADPVRRGFFQLAESGVANGDGITDALAINNFVHPGITIGAGVTLVDAACKMMLVPGQLGGLTFRQGRADGFILKAIQRL